VFLYAFDLVELNGDDLRRDPLAVRKATLASLLARAAPGLRFNEHLDEADGPLVFAHACKLGLEGIVSKRRDSRYRSGRSSDQEQESSRAGGEAGSRRRLGPVNPGSRRIARDPVKPRSRSRTTGYVLKMYWSRRDHSSRRSKSLASSRLASAMTRYSICARCAPT
jgi:hypothetical protein